MNPIIIPPEPIWLVDRVKASETQSQRHLKYLNDKWPTTNSCNRLSASTSDKLGTGF